MRAWHRYTYTHTHTHAIEYRIAFTHCTLNANEFCQASSVYAPHVRASQAPSSQSFLGQRSSITDRRCVSEFGVCVVLLSLSPPPVCCVAVQSSTTIVSVYASVRIHLFSICECVRPCVLSFCVRREFIKRPNCATKKKHRSPRVTTTWVSVCVELVCACAELWILNVTVRATVRLCLLYMSNDFMENPFILSSNYGFYVSA